MIRSHFWPLEPLHKIRQITTCFSYHNYMFTDFCGVINACKITLKWSSFTWVNEQYYVPCPCCNIESSKDPGLGITNLSIWFKEASFSSTTFTMLRETLSILQSFTYSDKPCFEKHWHEYSSTNFSLSFMVAFLNTLTFLSPSIHKKWRFPLRISCGFGHIHWRNSWWKICSACYAVNCPTGNHLQSIS